MKDMVLNDFKEKINLLRYEYNNSEYVIKREMKEDLYSNKNIGVFMKDTIWTYLNEQTNSPFFITYNDFLGRCKFYEDNIRLYPTNDK